MSEINHANFTPDAPNFKTLVRMSFQGLTNFPYIEEDFDSLTNYGFLSKVVEYLNEVISNNNEQNDLMTALYNAYVSLQNYVNDYFDNLDVQEEINNKLDEMAADGSLTELIKAYVDPIINDYKDEINATVYLQNTRIDNFNTILTNLTAASPTPVDNISAMTDTTKTYLLTTDGKWYYYDGTAWTAGGTYQATEIGLNDIEGSMIKDDTILPYSLKNVEYQPTQNVFGYAKWIRGYRYYNGELVEAEGYISTTDKIPVNPGATYTYSVPYEMVSPERVVKYNQSGTYVSESVMPATWTPSDCYYLAVTLKEDTFNPNIIKSSNASKYINVPWLNVNNPINKKIVVYGDSLWYNCLTNFNYTTTPYNQSTDRCYGYQQYLMEAGLSIDNYAISGGTSQTTAEHTGVNYPDNITTAHAQEYDAMIISFGRNDARTGLPIGTINDTGTDTYIGAIKHIIETMLTKNPKMKVFLWSATQTNAGGYGPDSVNSAGHKEIDYADALYTIADKYSCSVIDMYRQCGINMQNYQTYTFEGVHLTNEGYQFTAPYYKNAMINLLRD